MNNYDVTTFTDIKALLSYCQINAPTHSVIFISKLTLKFKPWTQSSIYLLSSRSELCFVRLALFDFCEQLRGQAMAQECTVVGIPFQRLY